NGLDKGVFFNRSATFGTGTGSVPFSSLVRVKNIQTMMAEVTALNAKVEAYIPKGVIWMWSGSIATIPAGFGLCDGTAGKPDLRDRFIVGAGSAYGVGAVGGAATHRLTESEMPIHYHHMFAETASKNNTTTGDVTPDDNVAFALETTSQYAYAMKRSYLSPTAGRTAIAGGSQPHNNLPPYYALAYIIKL
ncbi:MAG: hypothetical protein K2Q03_01925, partial [Sphingobacteriaceae bacterium]|nr:hypothetical protein [Sphingobacteriaceae bacterium]